MQMRECPAFLFAESSESIASLQAPIGGPSLAPALPNQPGDSAPLLPSPSGSTVNRSGGRVFVQPASSDASTRATTIGVGVGVGVLLLVTLGEDTLFTVLPAAEKTSSLACK